MRRAWLGLLLCLAAKPPDLLTLTPQQQHTIGLQTARAERRPIIEPVELPGTIAFDPDRVAILRAPAASRVLRLRAGPGDAVRRGQILAELDIPGLLDAQTRLSAARAALREAEAGVGVARLALRRGEILAADGALARAVAEQRRVQLAGAQAREAASQADLAAGREEIARLGASATPGMAAVATPIGGTVVSVDAAPGELLDSNSELFEVADLSTVIALAQLSQAQAALVAAGDSADVRLPGGDGRVWHGRVAALGAAVDPRSRTLPARIRVADPGAVLRGGMFVAVTIFSNRGRDSVTIPADAVQRVGDARVAFTPVGGGRFRRTDVTLGVQQPDWVEVRSGVAPGQAVVTQGSFTLKAMLQKALLGSAG